MNFSVIVHDKPIHRRAYDAIVLVPHRGEFITPQRQVRMNRARDPCLAEKRKRVCYVCYRSSDSKEPCSQKAVASPF